MRVLENSSKQLLNRKTELENTPYPDAGKLAYDHLQTSSVIKKLIDEDAARAATRKYDEIIYTEDYLEILNLN